MVHTNVDTKKEIGRSETHLQLKLSELSVGKKIEISITAPTFYANKQLPRSTVMASKGSQLQDPLAASALAEPLQEGLWWKTAGHCEVTRIQPLLFWASCST